MTYSPLPIEEVGLDRLLLDLDNYRIPSHRKDESAAIKYLFASEDVLGAAKLILRYGYFDNEVPIVIPASGTGPLQTFTVVEGNRRVSALKALLDPTIAPGHERELRALLKRYATEASDLPVKIRVMISPDRAVAAPHVARLHTGLSKKRWSLDQQSTFYYSLVDVDKSVADVRAEYPDVNVVKFIKMAMMRRFLSSVDFQDTNLKDFVKSDSLKMSVLEYAYSKKDIANAIGVAFDQDGQLEPKEMTPEKIGSSLQKPRIAALEYLISGFRAGRLNTRSPELLKDHNEHHEFIETLIDIGKGTAGNDTKVKPEPSTRPRDGAKDGDEDNPGKGNDPTPGSQPTSPDATGAGRGPNHPDTKDVLDLAGVPYDQAPVNLHRRYQELRKISLGTLPIAAAILLRSVLEATIKIHFESSPLKVQGELKGIFRKVQETYRSDKSLQAAIQSIYSSDASRPGSIIWFNMVAHSADGAVSAEEVRQAWELLNPLIRRLLRPYDHSGSSAES